VARWIALLLLLTAAGSAQRGAPFEIRRIWNSAAHNGSPDLVRYKNRWYCALREGSERNSPDGVVRVLSSDDGEAWTSGAVLSFAGDLRAPHLSVTPDDRLMLLATSVLPGGPSQSVVWFSTQGRVWEEPVQVGSRNVVLGPVTWRNGYGYSVGIHREERTAQLYVTRGGWSFQVHTEKFLDTPAASSASLLFLDDDRSLCLLARDAAPALLGVSKPPYRAWQWSELGKRFRAPRLVRTPDDRILAVGHIEDEAPPVSLAWVTPDPAAIEPYLRLPSGGEMDIPAAVAHDGMMWVAYASAHEGKSSVYLAKVKPAIPKADRRDPFGLLGPKK
jgi:hypothetical protein